MGNQTMTSTELAKAVITAVVGIGVGMLNDPLAGLVIGFMLAQLLFIYPKYQQMQLAAVAARRDRRVQANDPAQVARKSALVRYLFTQFAAVAIVLFAASGVLPDAIAIGTALPILLALMWVQLQILQGESHPPASSPSLGPRSGQATERGSRKKTRRG